MIYVVTKSANYYPGRGGGEDWEFVTRDLESAKLRAKGLVDRYNSAHVISINEDNLHAREILALDENGEYDPLV